MNYTIKYSKLAIADLDRVWSEVFGASKDYEITDNYINDLLDEIEKKTEYPKSVSPLYYDHLFTGYYYVVFKAYISFYRIENDSIFVDRILFGGSDYMRILGFDNEK